MEKILPVTYVLKNTKWDFLVDYTKIKYENLANALNAKRKWCMKNSSSGALLTFPY